MKRILLSIALSLVSVISLRAQLILQDSFSYGNGLTTNVSGFVWTNFSGGADSFVNNGKLEVFNPARSADIARGFTGAPASTVYASFIVNGVNLPNGSNYFAAFKDSGPANFRARVFRAIQGASPGSWRLGISAGSATPSKMYPLDLATNVDYRVVISYDTVTFTGTLWVDPVETTDQNVMTSDTTSAATLAVFAFRQAVTGGSDAGNSLIDDLYVGSSFADVNVGAVKAPVVYYQPEDPVTIFTGNSKNISCVAGGAGTVTFQWKKGGVDITDGATYSGTTSNVLSIVSATTSESGNYTCVVTSTTNGVFAGSVTSAISHVTVSAAPVPPTITTQPTNTSVYFGQTATFSVGAIGPGSITYTWYYNGGPLGPNVTGDGTPTLTISDVQTNNGTTGTYRVAVSNEFGGLLSANAVLSATPVPAVSIAYLRTLVDPATLQATNSTLPYKVTGTVTTYTNLTTVNTSSYYLQDGTAGINIFATFGSTFRPAQGDIVTFIGVVSSFTSGLELYADTVNRPYTSYSIVSSGNPLPAPISIPFNLTNAYSFTYIATNLAGALVKLDNVYFGAAAGTQIGGGTVTVTNSSGQPFYLSFFSQDLDTFGQTLPEFATSVTGVLYGNHPNYSVAVTKFSDIVTAAPSVSLNYSLSGGNLTLTWSDPSFNLQAASIVTGPYNTIVGATSGFTTNTLADQLYFRLVHP